MTTEDFSLRLESVKDWPLLRNASQGLFVLSVEAKGPDTGFGDLITFLAGSRLDAFENGGVIVAYGTRYDESRRFDIAISNRRGIVDDLAGQGIDLPGELVADELLRVENWRVRWGFCRFERTSLGDALDLCRRSTAVLASDGSGRTAKWASHLAHEAAAHLPNGDALFVAAAAEVQAGELLARGFGTFGDPVGIDLVGHRAVLESIRRDLEM